MQPNQVFLIQPNQVPNPTQTQYRSWFLLQPNQIMILYIIKIFTCEKDKDRPADMIMVSAWRERLVSARIETAKSALELVPDCPSALILLGEEDATIVTEAEQYFQNHKSAPKHDINDR